MLCETRRRLLLAPAALAALTALPAHAQTAFPSRPIQLIVPYAAGGGVDYVGRQIAPKLAEALGQPVVVENRSGGGSMIGSAAVATAEASGHTVLLNGLTLAMQPSLVKNLSYDVRRDFEPVGSIVNYGLVLTVNSNIAVTNLTDFVKFAREGGNKVFYGSPGNGTTPHLAAELFNSVAGVQMTHVPYRGNGPMMAGLLSGDIQAGFDTIQGSKALADGGKVRILALTGTTRSASAPQIPTAVEAGLPGFELDMWQGLFLPKGTPPAVVVRWNEALRKALADPGVKSRLAEAGFNLAPSSPAELKSLLSKDLERWARVTKTAGIQAE